MLKNLLFKTAGKRFGPLHFFTAGGITTFAAIQGLKYLAARSKVAKTVINKGFEVVEEKVEDLKGQILPSDEAPAAE